MPFALLSAAAALAAITFAAIVEGVAVARLVRRPVADRTAGTEA
jgi:hypothetical protein